MSTSEQAIEDEMHAADFDYALFASALDKGLEILKRGVNKFEDWKLLLIESVGEKISIWASVIWTLFRNYPMNARFDAKQLAAFTQRVGFLFDRFGEIPTYDKVVADFRNNFRWLNVEEYDPMIRAAYAGIGKFFENDNRELNESVLKKGTFVKSATKKATPKKTGAKKTAATKKDVDKKSVPSALEIQDYLDMGRVELSDTQAISVALIRNALKQEYLAIQRTQKTKDGEWKVKGGIWLPFENMQKIGDVIFNAYNEGLKMSGWGNTYKPVPKVYEFEKSDSELPPDSDIAEVFEQMILPFITSSEKAND